MEPEEFSNEFDILLNSYRLKNDYKDSVNPFDIHLDEYEKSLYLTKAQAMIADEYYMAFTQSRESFDSSEDMRRSFSNLIKTYETTTFTNDTYDSRIDSVLTELPTDLQHIILDKAVLDYDPLSDKEMEIKAVTHNEYNAIIRNPFRGPSDNRVLRLERGEGKIELISDYPIAKYIVKYIKKPNPIILENLPSGLSIDGINIITGCELHPQLHRIILDRAVQLAASTRISNNNK